jgi:peptide deformylase
MARANYAVGLAAQQCGVNARIVFLELSPFRSLVMVNPQIIERSPELEMRVWREHCLVLPPTFVATVLRDAWIVLEYQDAATGTVQQLRLSGEPARAAQHELDHDRGIMVT